MEDVQSLAILNAASVTSLLSHIARKELHIAFRNDFHSLGRSRDEDGLALADGLGVPLIVGDDRSRSAPHCR